MKFLMALLTLTIFTTACGTKGTMKEKVDHAKMEMTSHSKLDDVIRGEMAAIETYSQVVGKVTDQKEKRQLETFRNDHQRALATLQKYANQPVKDDAKSSGAWGTFAQAWTGGAKVFGEKTAVRALKAGEEHGLNEYEELLKEEKVSDELKEVIRTQLVPKQKDHINALNKLI